MQILFRHNLILLLFSAFMALGLASCKHTPKVVKTDFDIIKEKGTLNVLTLNSSTSYFMYRDEPMGYDYDLINNFCQKYGLKLIIKSVQNADQLVSMLQNGDGDIIAYELPIENTLKDSILYCGARQISHQVLVQHVAVTKKPLIQNVTELLGKEVYVRKPSKYYSRLKNLNAELGGGIKIKNISDSTTSIEDLIEMVSKNKIPYTFCDEYIAKLNKTYYHNIDISLQVSYDQPTSWAVSKKSIKLADALNSWFTENSKKPQYRAITKKYFELSKRPFNDKLELQHNLPKGTISQYDKLFKKHGKEFHDYNWLYLAAISYQESRFRNHLTSWAGAAGIMGLMPQIAKIYGISRQDRMNPDLSIRTSVKLLNQLNKILYRIKNKNERIKFILAAYNCGIGHIIDAQMLAKKYGSNPYQWDNSVKRYLALKSLPQYYNDPVCKNGYCRSKEPIRYVHNILKNVKRFQHITNKTQHHS